MSRLFIIALLLSAFCATTMAEGVLDPALQQAMNADRAGKFSVMISLKQELVVENMIARSRGGDRSYMHQVLSTQAEANQFFVKALCEKLQASGLVTKINCFWLANAMAVEASAEAIRELVLLSDVSVISLDAPQQMINPMAATNENERAAWGLAHIKSKNANEAGFNGEGVVVAVVDTGVNMTHPAFSEGQILKEKSKSFVSGESTAEDGHGHGTHCAGTIASAKYGVAPKAQIVPVKVLSASGSGTWEAVQSGVQYAAENADVMSMSLGGTASASGNVVETAVKNAIAAGIVCVIAAGNSGPGTKTIGTPGVVADAITIGAIDSSGTIASFSSRGPTVYGNKKPDLSAPGVNVTSAWKNGGENTISGTSMATPHVAGVVALVLGKNKNLTPAQVKQTLISSCFGTAADNKYGAGTVDALKCVNSIE